MFGNRRGIVNAIEILADPVESLQVAQASLSLFDIWLDKIAAFALTTVARLTFGEFRLDERFFRTVHHLVAKTGVQFARERRFAPQKTCFKKRGANGHVFPREANALADGAGRVSDLQPKIPEHEQDEFDDAFAPRGALERAKED